MNENKIVILIPAYEPDSKLLDLTYNLINRNFFNILIIDDGSTSGSKDVFKELSTLDNVRIKKHNTNQGKGLALKTGFNIILKEYPEAIGCITVDADGQHLPEDVEKMSNTFSTLTDDLILGVRDFDRRGIPFRSMVGNKLTRTVMNLFLGLKIEDTQTGLRAISKRNMEKFMKTSGDTYDFEMNMLVDSKKQNINITQVPIQTVYIDENASSHFNPIRDSLTIYKVFFKYILSSLSSSIVDIFLFALFTLFLNNIMPISYILVSTVLARTVSILFNYRINSNRVFKSKNEKKGSFFRYISLAILQMLTSAFLVSFISHSLIWNETMTKILVDIGLFFLSFIVQRECVFVSEDEQDDYINT